MKRPRPLIALILIAAAFVVSLLLFFLRAPVLVLTDESFAVLYGLPHLKLQQASASWALFRRIKPVMIADGAGPDIVILAIAEASKQPWCVLFPRNHALAATRFHEQFPEIPIALLSGLIPASDMPSPDGFLCVYGTDRETDLYRAGIFAGILGNAPLKSAKQTEKPEGKTEKQEKIAEAPQKPVQKTYILWQDRFVQGKERELFSTGLGERDPEPTVIFANSANDISDINKISCAVLTGAGIEYMEKNPRMPVILFSWLDPALAARELAVLFDDSVWALAVPAARMAAAKQAEGKIPSKPLIFSGKIGDNDIIRSLKKSAKKMP
ncbi:MAG: hypothetical protein LBG95_06040 [Treponema sp.]|jgi:hypothetical protein|nr:hypothetical protein [Treponema sp.]